jgi:hypothetical protein
MRETQRTSSSHQIPTLTLKSTAMSRVSEDPSGAPIRAGCTLARPLQLAACNLLCSYGLPGIETCRTSSSSEPRFSARGCKVCDNARRLCSFNALAYRAPQPRRCSTGCSTRLMTSAPRQAKEGAQERAAPQDIGAEMVRWFDNEQRINRMFATGSSVLSRAT